jgi:hypothetical protein
MREERDAQANKLPGPRQKTQDEHDKCTLLHPNVIIQVEIAHGNGEAENDDEADGNNVSVAEG